MNKYIESNKKVLIKDVYVAAIQALVENGTSREDALNYINSNQFIKNLFDNLTKISDNIKNNGQRS